MSRDAILRFSFFFHPSWNTTKLTNQRLVSRREIPFTTEIPVVVSTGFLNGGQASLFAAAAATLSILVQGSLVQGAGRGAGADSFMPLRGGRGGGRRIYLGRAGPLSARDVRACTQLSRGSRRLSPRSSHELETESGRGEWRREGGREGGGPWGLMNDAGGWPRPR